jgi:lipoate-protein ligase A
MRCIDFPTACNPALNLAREEHLFACLADKGDLLLFYVNTDAVVIGRNQVPWAEASAAGLAKAGLPLVRRVSGGGAVYHDPGNLNFSILLQADSAGHSSAATILQPVIRALQSLGLPARLSGRNAIFIDPYKVSGTAQYMSAGKILTHGTLLVDTDLDRLNRCLIPDPTYRIHSRGRSSVHRPVINLCDLRPGISFGALRRAIQQAFAATYGPITIKKPWRDDERAARALAADKYRTWAWNIGRSPQFTITWEGYFQERICRCRLEVRRGKVTRVNVEGPANPDGRLQYWAREWLTGKGLSRLRHPLEGLDGLKGAGNNENAFQRWLASHMPSPLPLPGASD